MAKKSFFASAMAIAIPVGLQSMLQSSFSMIDQLMVGQLGTAAVSAVEVASRPAFLYTTIVGAVATIAGIMIAQYLGMNAPHMTDRAISANLAVTGLLAGVFTAVCLLFPGQIIRIFVPDDAAVLAEGKDYMTLIVWTYLPMGLSAVLAVYIRCKDRAVLPLIAGLCSAGVNTLLNWVLIFGAWGFPALGVAGAAAASVISQLVNLLILIVQFARVHDGLFRFTPTLERDVARQYAAMLLPVLITEFLWSLGQTTNTYIYGHLQSGDLAAYAMTGTIQGLFVGALSGVSQAAGILVGKQLGANQWDTAYVDSKRLVWYGLAGSFVLSAFLIGLRGAYVQLYNVEPSVKKTCSDLLLAFALLAPVKVSNMILGGGVLRSGGRTVYIMAIDIIGTWGVGVPLGLWTGLGLHLPVVWVYTILSMEEVVRLIITAVVFRRRTWMQQLRRQPS